MPDIIEGFSQVEYLIVFNAIVFGAIASEYFGGWGAMLRNRDLIQFSPLQFIFSVFAFLILIQNWYALWPRSKYINDGAGYFYFSLVPMLIFYLIGVVLFPQMKYNMRIDFGEHYRRNAKILYVLFGIYYLFTIVGSLVYWGLDQGNVFNQNILRVVGLLGCTLCYAFPRNYILHYLFISLSSLGLILFIFQIGS